MGAQEANNMRGHRVGVTIGKSRACKGVTSLNIKAFPDYSGNSPLGPVWRPEYLGRTGPR